LFRQLEIYSLSNKVIREINLTFWLLVFNLQCTMFVSAGMVAIYRHHLLLIVLVVISTSGFDH